MKKKKNNNNNVSLFRQRLKKHSVNRSTDRMINNFEIRERGGLEKDGNDF